MFKKLGELFGGQPSVNFRKLIDAGAQVIDVRSREEYAAGHLKGSLNIPLPELSKSIGKINKNKPVIVCCASGMRSSTAKSVLGTQGFDVHNGGGWQSLQRKTS